jgi:hypothetical protein
VGIFDSEDAADECIEECKRAEPQRYDDDCWLDKSNLNSTHAIFEEI